MYPLFFLAGAVIASLVHIFIKRQRDFTTILQTFLMWLLFFCVGLQGIFAWMGHTFMANQIARQIGWPTGSPFQFEVAVANLGIGLAGVMALFWKGRAWLMLGITYLTFLYGDAYGHIVQMQKGDTSPYNSGIFLYIGDGAIPTLILILLVIYYFKVIKTSPN
jgi:hypothetical protein